MSRKVLMLLPYLKRRGTEIQTLNIARHLQRSGFQVEVIAISDYGGFQSSFTGAEIPVTVLFPGTGIPRRMFSASLVWRLVREIRRRRPCAVVGRAGAVAQLTSWAAFLARAPSVVFLSAGIPPHGSDLLERLRKLKSAVRLVLNTGAADRVVSVSGETAARYRRRVPIKRGRVVTVHNGVEIPAATAAGIDRQEGVGCRVLFTGSLDMDRKGLDILLTGFARAARDEGPDQPVLDIVGSGRDESRLRGLAAELELGDRVRFHGESATPADFFQAADIFVLPSRREGFPNVLLEAMSYGLPCIAADCETGPREIIEHEVNGILIAPADPGALETALLRLVDRPDLRSRLGSAARRTVIERFGLDQQLARIEQVILPLCEGRRE